MDASSNRDQVTGSMDMDMDGDFNQLEDYDDDKPEFSCSANLNPLYIENIAAKVLSYLSIDELKIVRLVCPLWADEGARHLLRKAFVLLNKFENDWEDESAVKESAQILCRFLIPLQNRPSGHIKIFLEDYRYTNAWKILSQDFVPGLTARVHTLKFPRNIRLLDDYNRLPQLLEKCPNLRILETTEIDISSYERFLMKEDSPNFEVDRQSFLSRLQNLQEIRLIFPPIKELRLRHYAQQPDAFRNVTQVDIQEKLVPLFLQQYPNLRWKLKEVKLALDPISNKEVVREFLSLFADTLRHLTVEWEKDRGVVIPSAAFVTPWRDDWFIPLNLTRLESLKFHYTKVDDGVDVCRWRTLAVALQLPKLERLSTNLGFPCSLVREEVRRWEEDSAAQSRKLSSGSIKEVEIIRVRDEKRISLGYGDLFKGLKTLKIEFETTLPLSSSLFQEWTELERLELDFRMLDYVSCRKCAWWLTGLEVPRPETYTNEQVRPQSDEQARIQKVNSSIRDLTNLKSLTIWGPRLHHNGLVLGDFFIYNCLIFMKRLQSVRLYNARFTKKGLKDLKDSLGFGASLTGGYVIPHPLTHFPQPHPLTQIGLQKFLG